MGGSPSAIKSFLNHYGIFKNQPLKRLEKTKQEKEDEIIKRVKSSWPLMLAAAAIFLFLFPFPFWF